MSPADKDDSGARLPLAETESAAHTSGARLDEALVQARPMTTEGLPLAEERIAGTLFGPDAARGFGRFRLLERLGSGGMGVVYSAYDPDLRRLVALKIVRVPSSGRQSALAEARALARLAHPNVVPVYDVGVEADCVYIVMELVHGETLRGWAQGRDRRAILDAYAQAGRALAVAHSAGLVHRDFKPDNAVVGRDDRVRVVDFGLAREAADPSDPAHLAVSVGGTPRYMAPEQAAGKPVTPAADQYSFCVALREALCDEDRDPRSRRLPRWIARALDRGCAPDAGARFASMSQLLAALARDPVRVWRRRIAQGAVLVVVAATAFFGGIRGEPEICGAGAAELAATWDPLEQATALARIARMGSYGRMLAPQLDRILHDHASRWIAGYRDACLAHHRGEQSAAVLDRRMACLARGRSALAAVAGIVGSADSGNLPEIARAARTIPDPASCADIDTLVADTAPPPPAVAKDVARVRDQLERAHVLLAAGLADQARAVAATHVARARDIGYRPLLAEALLVEGHAIMLEDRAGAVPILTEATNVAMLAGADAMAVEAWARRAWAQGTDSDPEGALANVDLVEALAARTPS